MANHSWKRYGSTGILVLLGFAAGVFIRSHSPTTLQSSAIAAPAAPKTTDPSSDIAPSGRRKTPVVKVVETVSPAVVTVGAIKRRVVAQPWYDDFFFPSIRYREQRNRMPYMGSGFLVDERGYVITNFHVIEDSESLFVTFPDGREFPATLMDADKFIDVALLKVEADGATLPEPIKWGSSENLLIGEEAVAFGNPFGTLIEDSRPTITVGFISALHRTFRPDVRNQRVYQDMIQTDAAINPGNSGGPLVDLDGAVVGVNTFIVSPSGGSTGIGFAIPVERVKSFFDEIIAHGKLRPLLLDFAYQTIRSNRVQGVQITGILPGGPAEKSGLAVGDVLMEVDGRPVMDRETFFVLFASRQVGSKVRLTYWRNGEVNEAEYVVQSAR